MWWSGVNIDYDRSDYTRSAFERWLHRSLSVRLPGIEQDQPTLLPFLMGHIFRQLRWSGEVSPFQHLQLNDVKESRRKCDKHINKPYTYYWFSNCGTTPVELRARKDT